MAITSIQRSIWKAFLELRLLKLHGDPFQDFFSDLMEKKHGTSFVRVKAMGRLGDKKCDGYLSDGHEVFQCYGAKDGGGESKVAYLIGKMEADYSGAAVEWPGMNSWHMVHNFMDGMPARATEALMNLKAANPQHNVFFFGPPKFEAYLFSLKEEDIGDLLGPAAVEKDFPNIQIPEVREIMERIISATLDVRPSDESVGPVRLQRLKRGNTS